MKGSEIYLDNAATSWPKPPEVARAMTGFLEEVGANPGRSGHRRSVEAARIVYDAREALAGMFGLSDPCRVVFTANCTEALNLAIQGLLAPGSHAVTSSMEHNSAMRPLRALEEEGVGLTVVRCSPQGLLDPSDIEKAMRPNTRLIIVNHASNVTGTLQPIGDVGRIARKRGIPFLVDAAQSAGAFSMSMRDDAIDMLAFPGHKALYGPMGTGALLIGEGVEERRITPLLRGGTGSRSEREIQPELLPDRLESGTLNAVGIDGLLAGLRWVNARGIESIRAHERRITQRLIDGLRGIGGITVQGSVDAAARAAVVSFAVAGAECSDVGQMLDERYGILCRVGLHCAPAAHRTLGTFPQGTVRFSPGAFTTDDEIDRAIHAVEEICRQAR